VQTAAYKTVQLTVIKLPEFSRRRDIVCSDINCAIDSHSQSEACWKSSNWQWT